MGRYKAAPRLKLSERMQFMLTKEDREKLEAAAKKKRRPVSTYVRDLILEGIDSTYKQDSKKAGKIFRN